MPPKRSFSKGILLVFLIGPLIFLVVGGGFLVGSAAAPPGALTDDGYPLDRFLLLMGGIFGGMGAVWLALALFGISHAKKKAANTEARREHLLRYGLQIQAHVVSVSTDGYMNFQNELWTDLVLQYDVPGAGRRHVSRRIGLAQALLDHARAHKILPILVDPRAPDDYLLP